jgi:hypothetical protein
MAGSWEACKKELGEGKKRGERNDRVEMGRRGAKETIGSGTSRSVALLSSD